MKVVLWMAISLNGIVATLDNKEDFLSHDNWNAFVLDVKKRRSLIWGRKTYELVRTWDSSYLAPFAEFTKIILSKTPDLKLDSGFTLANSPEQALDILKKKGLKEVILTGGSTNNSSFAKLGLIDEVIVNIEGVIVGRGIPLFKADNFILRLKLLKTKKISSNILQLRYKVLK